MSEARKGIADESDRSDATGPDSVEKAEFRQIIKEYSLLFELLG